jgi:hypothetical protein
MFKNNSNTINWKSKNGIKIEVFVKRERPEMY